MQVWAIIRDTIREISVKKLFWINIAVSMFIVLTMACWSFDDKGARFLWYSFDSQYWNTSHELYRSIISYFIVRKMLIAYYIGWFGTILGLISTAGIFPSMMEKGAIDGMLSRPLSRWKLFFAKYVGSLFFMVVQATVFVVCTLLVMGIRWKVWFPGYLLSIPLLILLFSYLYCMCVLFGLWTRSGLTSLLLTLAFWFVIWLPQASYGVLQSNPELKKWPNFKRAVTIFKWMVPNTSEIPARAEKLMDDSDLTKHMDSPLFDHPDVNRNEIGNALAFETRMKRTPWYYTIGSSLLFEAVVLLLAGWRFSRLDF